MRMIVPRFGGPDVLTLIEAADEHRLAEPRATIGRVLLSMV